MLCTAPWACLPRRLYLRTGQGSDFACSAPSKIPRLVYIPRPARRTPGWGDTTWPLVYCFYQAPRKCRPFKCFFLSRASIYCCTYHVWSHMLLRLDRAHHSFVTCPRKRASRRRWKHTLLLLLPFLVCAVCGAGYGTGVGNSCHACTTSFQGGMFFLVAVVFLLGLVLAVLLAVYLVR